MAQPLSTPTPNPTRGKLLALLVIPAGMALWILLWSWGFMSAIVSFVIAYGAVWLFQVGAKTTPTRADTYYLLVVILIGVIASFLGGMISDAWSVWAAEMGNEAKFLSGDFWSFVGANITNGDLWKSYSTDILIAFVFAILGAGALIKDLLQSNNSNTPTPA